MCKYDTNVEPKLDLIEAWARDGVIDEDIAHNLGISYSTFREYVKKYPALSAVLKKGKEVVDYQVENALLKRALGYKYDEVTRERDAQGTLVVTKVVTKQVVPDVTAQIFWLKNRKPEVWRDRVELGGDVSVTANEAKDAYCKAAEAIRKIATESKPE